MGSRDTDSLFNKSPLFISVNSKYLGTENLIFNLSRWLFLNSLKFIKFSSSIYFSQPEKCINYSFLNFS